MKYVISVDAGTSSLRAVLADSQGGIVYTAQEKYSPLLPAPGYVEMPPEEWQKAMYRTVCRTADYADSHGMRVEGIGVTALRTAVFPADCHGKPLMRAMLWYDQRNLDICRALEQEMPRLYDKTGLRLDPMFSAPKMTWLKRHRPDLYQTAYRLAGAYEYLLFHLCGAWVSDHSIAARTMLYNLDSGDWDRELLELFEIDRDKLCAIVPQGAVCGYLTEEAAGQCGLKAGLPVVAAGGDQQCGTLGLGLTEYGQISVTGGTGGYISYVTDTPVRDGAMGFLCTPAAVPGRYVLEIPVLTAGNVFQWYVRQANDGRDGAEAYRRMEHLIEAAAPGADGLIFFPYFKGAGAPYWKPEARGGFLRMGLEHGPAEMARAVLEGIVLEMTENIHMLENVCGHRATALYLSGGMTRTPAYRRIMTDAAGRPAVLCRNPEATALGAAFSVMQAVGLISGFDQAAVLARQNDVETLTPDENCHRQYREVMAVRARYREKVLFHT